MAESDNISNMKLAKEVGLRPRMISGRRMSPAPLVIYNLKVVGPKDATPGATLPFAVHYDVVGGVADLKTIVVTLETLEYSVQDPSKHENPHPNNAELTAHHHHGLFARKEHKGAGLSDHAAKTLQTVQVVNAPTAKSQLLPEGPHDHPFQLTVPANIPPTGAFKDGADAKLRLYRIKVEVAQHIGNAAHEVAYAVLHVLPQ
ncbi:hypothetical protein HK101_011882 [Irineochytrium annulatum]|nr:hypothetical protein HK101_011882 [Irineochytrium annulatum]